MQDENQPEAADPKLAALIESNRVLSAKIDQEVQEVRAVADLLDFHAHILRESADTPIPANMNPLLLPERQRYQREWDRVATLLRQAATEMRGGIVGERVVARACGLKLRTNPIKPTVKLTVMQGGKV